MVGMVAMAVATLFATARCATVGESDVSRFVVAGSVFSDPAQTPQSLYVFPDAYGYDGQFYWRLAAAPTHVRNDTHLGVTMDQPLRLQRVGYPYLAWLFSLGQVDLVPLAMLLVNLVAIGLLASLGAIVARDAGRSPWWGLGLVSIPGFVFTLSRDLTEIVAAVAIVGAVLASRRSRWWWCGALWGFGVLTREQVLVPVAVFAAWNLLQIARRRRSVGRQDVAWSVPLLLFGTWQAVVYRVDGALPQLSGSSNAIGAPFVGVADAFRHWVRHLGDAPKDLAVNGLAIYELFVLVAVVLVAMRCRSARIEPWVRASILAVAGLAMLLTPETLYAASDLRILTDLSVLSWVVLLTAGSARSLRVLTALQVAALVGAAATRLVSI